VTSRLPSKAERRTLLRERGWTRLGSRGSESWRHPRYPRTIFTLAAAYRAEVAFEAGRRLRIHPPPQEPLET
jgi:hypothetical protein